MVKISYETKKQQALDVIRSYFAQATKDHSKANDYIRKARRVAMKLQMPLPREYKRRFCTHCYSFFYSGNYRVRTRKQYVVYLCLSCKKFMRFLKR